MHILQLTDFYRPVIGGLERHVETLSRELVQLGHTVTVVTIRTGEEPPEEMLDGVHVLRIRGWSAAGSALHEDASRPFHPPFPDPGAMAMLSRVVDRERPAVVHNHQLVAVFILPAASQATGTRPCGHIALTTEWHSPKRRWNILLDRHRGQPNNCLPNSRLAVRRRMLRSTPPNPLACAPDNTGS